MGDVDLLVEQARAVADEIVKRARAELLIGTEVGRVHERVVTAIGLLEDVESYALLAGSGERSAEEAIERSIRELQAVRDAMADHRD